MYRVTTHQAIGEIPREQWNRLVDPDTPFLRHEFLAALEEHGCVGESTGWVPCHLALRDRAGQPLALAPCYLKFNSYGEFVFDWGWADAYRRHGRRYYPKLVVASPYTPATGPRILTGDTPRRPEYIRALAAGAAQVVETLDLSSLHWLFTTAEETDLLTHQGLLRRTGCQFHWHNQGYGSFDDLLGAFTAEKRKKIKRERRRIGEQGIRLRQVRGDQASESEWATFHQLYCDTFDKRGGIPTLTLPFFLRLAETMGRSLLLVLAYHDDAIVAAAFDLIGERSLYGRHWGCFRDFDRLHFEACYYQGLEFCIEQGLQRFEPGAQGEHKISRGFVPTPTWSAHWIADPDFRQAISQHLAAETREMQDYLTDRLAHVPYREQITDARAPSAVPPTAHSHDPTTRST